MQTHSVFLKLWLTLFASCLKELLFHIFSPFSWITHEHQRQTLICSAPSDLLKHTCTHAHTLLNSSTHRWPGPSHFLSGRRITGLVRFFCSVVLTDLFMDRNIKKTHVSAGVCGIEEHSGILHVWLFSKSSNYEKHISPLVTVKHLNNVFIRLCHYRALCFSAEA